MNSEAVFLRIRSFINATFNKIHQQFNIHNQLCNSAPAFHPEELDVDFKNITIIFSRTKKDILICFNNKSRNFFVDNDVIDYFDRTNIWKESNESLLTFKKNQCPYICCREISAGHHHGPYKVRFEGNGHCYSGNCATIHHVGFSYRSDNKKPIIVAPNNSPVFLKSFTIFPPNKADKKKISYGIMLNMNFIEACEAYADSIIKFANDIVIAIIQEKNMSEKRQRDTFLKEMKRLFFDNEIPEDEIDKFILQHFYIFNLFFNFDMNRLLPKLRIKDIFKKYGQDLIPDLIAYSLKDQKWYIVDYKRSGKKIIKNAGMARAGFMAEVNDLQSQLMTYREVFNEIAVRDEIQALCGHYIEYPDCIGIIGTTSNEEEKREIHRQKANGGIPNWLQIIPFNNIYDFVEMQLNSNL